MAKRRALARALAGLGQGIANASQQWMGHLQREQLQDRYDKRADASAAAAAKRADEAELDRVSREIRMKVAAGDIEPQAAAAMLSQLAPDRFDGDAAALEPIRPSLSKRIGKKFDPMMDSPFPEGLPTDEELATFVKGEGGMIPGALDIPMSSGNSPSGIDPFSMLRQEAGDVARDFSNSVGARRRSLMSRPTERIEKKDPITGVKSIETMSPYEMQSGVEVGPSAEQEGALEGQQRSAFLETAGAAEAEQAGNVAGATEDARNTPARQGARTREAVNREIQIIKGTMPFKMELAKQTAAIEIQQAVNKENETNVAAAIKASGALMGPQFFDKVVDITRRLNDEDGLDARFQGALTTAGYYLGGAPDLKNLEQVVSQNRRLLAQAFGVKEGNPSDKDMENVRAAIGLDQWSTKTERINALRTLQDMISIGPIVARRLPAQADIATRMELAKSLSQARREAEEAAIAANALEYNDPVTNSRIKVIR